jgi:hypothetical protein
MTSYVRSAPETLTELHRTKQIGKGYKYLTLLLTHPEMQQAWAELAKHKKREDHATRLLSEILSLLQAVRPGRVVLRRADEAARYTRIAEQAEALAAAITNGPLDKLSYEYFSAQDMSINGIENWDACNSLERAAQAHRLLPIWPSLVEQIAELGKQARCLGDEALSKPRLVDRQLSAEDYRQLYFVRGLARYITGEYGAPLYGTVAHITNAVLGAGFSKKEVAKKAGGPAKAL